MTDKPKSVLLIGPPGTGKTDMMCRTAIHQPVHVLDIDRKIGSSARLEPLIKAGTLTYVEIAESMLEDDLTSRFRAIAKSKAPLKEPQGWLRLAEAYYQFPKTEEGKRAGTWGLDSATFAGEHFKSFICYHAQKSKFTFDQWSAYLSGWRDTISFMRDLARENGKDLMITVHERFKETPGDRVTGVTQHRVVTATGETMSREFRGQMDPKVVASIDGQFGLEVGASFDEVYALSVEMDNDKPKWVCRVRPDGLRNLRTSFQVTQDEYEPDFRQIWKVTK